LSKSRRRISLKLTELISAAEDTVWSRNISGSIDYIYLSGKGFKWALELYERIKNELSPEEFTIELLCFAARFNFPLDAIVPLVNAVGIDTQVSVSQESAMFAAVKAYRVELVNEFAYMKADLKVKGPSTLFGSRQRNKDLSSLLRDLCEYAEDPNYEAEEIIEILEKHGLQDDWHYEENDEEIPVVFRSTLPLTAHVPPQPKRLAQEKDQVRFYLRAMTLPLEELEKEAKERFRKGKHDWNDRTFPLLCCRVRKYEASLGEASRSLLRVCECYR
jgi:hypothetical protein